MALQRSEKNQIAVPDGEPMLEYAKELGVSFGCHSGLCGTCRIEVLEGMENLSPKTEEEIILECTGNQRQACQCKILQGTVKIHF